MGSNPIRITNHSESTASATIFGKGWGRLTLARSKCSHEFAQSPTFVPIRCWDLVIEPLWMTKSIGVSDKGRGGAALSVSIRGHERASVSKANQPRNSLPLNNV